jgi:phenylacetate-CoA ligase
VESIQGRVNDLILARDGSPVHSELLGYINRTIESMGFGIGQYVMVQKSLERLTLLVNRDTELSEEAERYIREQLGRFLGQDVQLTVERVDALPRDKSGKMRYFISEVAEGRIHGG